MEWTVPIHIHPSIPSLSPRLGRNSQLIISPSVPQPRVLFYLPGLIWFSALDVRHQHAHAYIYRAQSAYSHTPNYPKGPALIRRPTWSPPLVIVRRALIPMARGKKKNERVRERDAAQPNPTPPPLSPRLVKKGSPGWGNNVTRTRVSVTIPYVFFIQNTTTPSTPHHNSSCTPYNSVSGSSCLYAAKSKSSKQTHRWLCFFRVVLHQQQLDM